MDTHTAANPPPAFADSALQVIMDFLPSGVTRFDRDLNMIMCNRQFRTLLEFPDSMFENGLPSLQQLAIFNAERGEYGPGEPVELAAGVVARARRREAHVFERCRPDGRTLEIRGNPLPDGGFVTIYTDITERKRAEDEARRAASYLDAVVNALPQGVTVIDEALNLVRWNPAFVTIQNLPEGFMRPGTTFTDVIRFNAERGEYGPVDPDEKVRQMVELARRFEPHRMERTRSDGGVMEVEGRIVMEGSRTLGFVTTYTDITDRVRHERTIRRVRDLMRDAVNFSPTYIWETDRLGRYTFVQGAQKILGTADASMIGENRWKVLFAADGDAGATNCGIVETIAQRGPIERRVIHTRHCDGSEMWLSCSAQPVFDEAGGYVGYRGVDVDVTELTRAQHELEQIALHDPLTGLANRRKFMTRYELEQARQHRAGGSLSLLLMDIDHFKRINDTLGHLAGDDCLRKIAKVLTGSLRAVDLVARFGGEEFVVLLCDTGPEQAVCAAEQLRAAVAAAPFDGPDGHPVRLTVSIGVATRAPADARDFDHLLAQADRGAYAAKAAGRNRVCVGGETHCADPAAEPAATPGERRVPG